MKIGYTAQFKEKINKLNIKDKKSADKIFKQIDTFSDDSNHPSLRNHKLKGTLKETWSISAGKSIRILYTLTNNEVIFFDFGTHDEVYR